MFTGNSVGRVLARLLGGRSHQNYGQHQPGGAGLGEGSKILDSRPVHKATAGDESAHSVPRHSVHTAVQKQHPKNQHWVSDEKKYTSVECYEKNHRKTRISINFVLVFRFAGRRSSSNATWTSFSIR